MKVEFKPSNICANKIIFDLDDGVVRNVVFIGGCDGNHKAIASLCEGRNAEEIAKSLTGLTCGPRKTSCGDQFARGILQALEQQKS